MNRRYFIDEVWKDLIGYEGLYQISNYGRIMSFDYGKKGVVRRLQITAFGGNYLKVKLRDRTGAYRYHRVNRLVALNFLQPPDPGHTQVEHIDGNRQNNYVRCVLVNGEYMGIPEGSNLRWTTPKGNMSNPLTRLRISIAKKNPPAETRLRMSRGQKRRYARERATHTGRYLYS